VITCVLCGKPMAVVAVGVLVHLYELRSLIESPRRATFEPLSAAG
jgi:hypothetical protein